MARTIQVPHPEDEFGKNPVGQIAVPDEFSDERVREEIKKAQSRYQELNVGPEGQTRQERRRELMEERDAGVGTLVSIGTGAARELASGVGATMGLALAPHEPSAAMSVYEGVQENFPVYEPQDEKSQRQLQAIQEMARPVMMGIRDVFSRPNPTIMAQPALQTAESAGLLEDVPDMTGQDPVHPAISTTAETLTLGALELVGAGRGIPNRLKVNKALKEIEDSYRREFGVELGSAEIRDQIARAADARTANARGEALVPVREELVQARNKAWKEANQAFEAARNPAEFKFESHGLQADVTDSVATPSGNGMTVKLRNTDPNREVRGRATNLDGEEDAVGALEAARRGEDIQVINSSLHESLQGQGLGTELYQTAIDNAMRRHGSDFEGDFVSDRSVSFEAQKVWESLRERGYNVEKLPENQVETVEGGLSADKPIYRLKLDDNAKRLLNNRTRPAAVRARSMEELRGDMQAQLERGYSRRALDRMEGVQDMLGEIDDMRLDASGRPNPTKKVTLEEIDDLRRQISNLRSGGWKRGDASPQDKALTTMKGQLDTWLQKRFNEDMILGDPQNLKQWERARGLWQYYKKNFKEDQVIKKFVEQESTPEMMRHWLLNSSKTGFKKEAGLVVGRMKELLGPDNPAINGIRTEFMFDVVQPLLKDEPDLKTFINRYDEALKNNSGLVKELDVDQKDLRKLHDLAKAADKTKAGAGFLGKMDAPLIISRVLLGNRLAKATLRQNLLRQSIVAMKGRGESAQRQMIRQMVGYDPEAPLVPKGSVEANSVVAEVFTNALENGESNNDNGGN